MMDSLPLSHQDLFKLQSDGKDSDLLQDPHCILGIIFAVAAAPDIPLPDVWFGWLFKPSVNPADIRDLPAIHAAVMACLQWQLQQMRDDKTTLPECLHYSEQSNSPLARWMQGLLLAHTHLETVWQQAWQAMLATQQTEQQKLHKDLKHCLSVFSTFADIPFALSRANQQAQQLAAALPRIYQSLPGVLQTYVSTSGQLVEYLPNQFERFVSQQQ